jgi:hypothetical protein
MKIVRERITLLTKRKFKIRRKVITPNTIAQRTFSQKKSDNNLKAPFQQKYILKKAQNHKETVSQCKFKNQTNL